jgi:DNA-binding PadR family transcriptional regulator
LKSKTNPEGGKRARRDYSLTAKGRAVLAVVREQARERYDEIVAEVENKRK